MKARVIKIISNQFTILLDEVKCLAKLSGKMRLKDKVVLGDFVEVIKQENEILIIDIFDRKNILYRPNVANVEQVFIVMSCNDPDFDYSLVNRLLFLIEYNDIKPIIIITKSDLDLIKANKIQQEYELLGYQSLILNQNDDMNIFLDLIKNKVSVLTGQSGVGKSSLLNKLNSKLNLKTQTISKSLKRGKHTTTHHELYEIESGYLADTPGFSSLILKNIDLESLRNKNSFLNKFNKCRFLNCQHIKEPGCQLLSYLENNCDYANFYQDYLDIVSKIEKERKW